MKEIEIKEEVRIPGTNVILEKGDKIQIKERIVDNTMFAGRIQTWVQNSFDQYWEKQIEIEEDNDEIQAGQRLLADLKDSLESLMGGRIEIDWRAR